MLCNMPPHAPATGLSFQHASSQAAHDAVRLQQSKTPAGATPKLHVHFSQVRMCMHGPCVSVYTYIYIYIHVCLTVWLCLDTSVLYRGLLEMV